MSVLKEFIIYHESIRYLSPEDINYLMDRAKNPIHIDDYNSIIYEKGYYRRVA